MQSIEKKIRNLKVKKKLNVLVVTLLAALVLFGVISGISSYVLNLQTKEITSNWLPSAIIAENMNTVSSDYRMRQYGHVVASTEAEFKMFEEELEQLLSEMNTLIASYKDVIAAEEEEELFEEAVNSWNSYLKLTEEVVQLSRNKQTEQANALMIGEAKQAFESFSSTLGRLTDYNQVGSDEASETSELLFIVVMVIIIALLIVFCFIGWLLSKVVSDNIINPVTQIVSAATEMHKGNMKASNLITYQSEDEFGKLADSMRNTMNTLDSYIQEISDILVNISSGDLTTDFNEITDFLGDFVSIKESFVHILKEFNNILTRIQMTSQQVDSGSDEIAQAANELSAGTSEQASAVEELNATINTVSSQAESSAKQTSEAYNKIIKSVENAEKERRQMHELQEEMSHIKAISNEIETIITAIEEIASQTSLLALNASIEAARAGEAGRGFAVVADQIGKLATDSAQAVVNTKSLISKTIEEIDKGNEITVSTATAFETIITDMRDFAEIAKKTSEMATGQAVALSQVEQGIEQISAVTQANASASEECSAVSEELAARATELDELVKRFKLHTGK